MEAKKEDFSKYPKLIFGKDSTFFERLKSYSGQTNPKLLFVTKKEALDAKRLLYSGNVSEKEKEKLRGIVFSVFHRTNESETIPKIFRISSLAAISTISSLGMTLSNTNSGVFFWQTLNQVYVNFMTYYNRSSAKNLQWKNRIINLCVGVTGASGTALLINNFAKHSAFLASHSLLKSLALFSSPFIALAVSAALNIGTTRKEEFLTKGTIVYDSQGNPRGFSKIAGRKAIWATYCGRISQVACVLLGSPLLVKLTFSNNFLKANSKILKVPVSLLIFYTVFISSLPLTLALFPQIMKTKSKSLENEFHDLKSLDSKTKFENDHLFFYKGA